MTLVSVSEIEDIYMGFKQALQFDRNFKKSMLEKLNVDTEYKIDETSNRTKFISIFENYVVKGYLESDRVILESKRRDAQKCVEKFLEKINEI